MALPPSLPPSLPAGLVSVFISAFLVWVAAWMGTRFEEYTQSGFVVGAEEGEEGWMKEGGGGGGGGLKGVRVEEEGMRGGEAEMSVCGIEECNGREGGWEGGREGGRAGGNEDVYSKKSTGASSMPDVLRPSPYAFHSPSRLTPPFLHTQQSLAAVQNVRLDTSCGILEEGGTPQGGGAGEHEEGGEEEETKGNIGGRKR